MVRNPLGYYSLTNLLIKEKKRIDFSEKLVYQSGELFFVQAVSSLSHLMNR
jgi:hypothetical protein